MNRINSILLLICGVVLIAYGVNASGSIGSAFSRLSTGFPTDKTIWIMVGGVIASIFGVFGLLRKTKSN